MSSDLIISYLFPLPIHHRRRGKANDQQHAVLHPIPPTTNNKPTFMTMKQEDTHTYLNDKSDTERRYPSSHQDHDGANDLERRNKPRRIRRKSKAG